MAIPLGDLNPTRRRGYVTLLLIAINIGVFVLWQPWGGDVCEQSAFYARWGAIPDEVVELRPLNQAELDTTVDPRCGVTAMAEKSVALSVLVAMFLHGGWAHLLGNMLYLWVFGDNVEDRLGHGQFLVFYLVCGTLATVLFAGMNPNSTGTLVGASGAIAGVLGAYFVLFPHSRITVIVPPLFFLPFRMRAGIVLGLWFIFQLLEVQVDEMAGGGVAYLAHVAGFIAGVVLTYVFGVRTRRTAYRY